MFDNDIFTEMQKKCFLTENTENTDKLIYELNEFAQDMDKLTEAHEFKSDKKTNSVEYGSLRNDDAYPSYSAEEITSNAKNKKNNCIYVPKVI